MNYVHGLWPVIYEINRILDDLQVRITFELAIANVSIWFADGYKLFGSKVSNEQQWVKMCIRCVNHDYVCNTYYVFHLSLQSSMCNLFYDDTIICSQVLLSYYK